MKIMQPNMHAVITPKEIAIKTGMWIDFLCCTDELSGNIVYLVSSVVILLVFDFDELRKREKRPMLTYSRKNCKVEK